MTTYYVGPGGNNSNNGTTWALRKLTISGAEDIPVAAGDTVYVGPGVYRETLWVDVSGTAGNIITYIADVTGQNTDGVGGVVRISGSDNDTATARANCISANNRSYRTFRGFLLNGSSSLLVSWIDGSHVVFDDCNFLSTFEVGVRFGGAGTNRTIRNSVIWTGSQFGGFGIQFTDTGAGDQSDTASLIENCIIFGGGTQSDGINITNIGDVTIKNCLIFGCARGVFSDSLASGQTTKIYNCIIQGNGTGIAGNATTATTENYNCLYGNVTARSNTTSGANSNTYLPLFSPFLFGSALKFPQQPLGALSEWSGLRAIAGTSMATDDMFGVTRPTTDSKKSWGPIQYMPISRDTATKRTGAASIKLADAARHQMFVPTDGTSTVFSVYAYWEADYAGDKPQLIVKQPGQSDSTDTATGTAENWEELTLTLTPAASPAYVIVELVSRNTATSGSYGTYFDDLTVT